jgi:DNA-nicking Smr family endonuclease
MGGRRRHLSEADRALWARVAETLRPLGAKRPDTALKAEAPSSPPPAPASAKPAAPLPLPPLRRLEPVGRPEPLARWHAPGAERPRPPGPDTPGLDRNTARRLARGQREPEARLDLHGMTADRAHAALMRFVIDCAQQGLRCVLVVTGMGGGDNGRRRGDGVLRRETPRWLSVPPLSGHVVGVFEAHPRHGGGGALYIYLKRQR